MMHDSYYYLNKDTIHGITAGGYDSKNYKITQIAFISLPYAVVLALSITYSWWFLVLSIPYWYSVYRFKILVNTYDTVLGDIYFDKTECSYYCIICSGLYIYTKGMPNYNFNIIALKGNKEEALELYKKLKDILMVYVTTHKEVIRDIKDKIKQMEDDLESMNKSLDEDSKEIHKQLLADVKEGCSLQEHCLLANMGQGYCDKCNVKLSSNNLKHR